MKLNKKQKAIGIGVLILGAYLWMRRNTTTKITTDPLLHQRPLVTKPTPMPIGAQTEGTPEWLRNQYGPSTENAKYVVLKDLPQGKDPRTMEPYAIVKKGEILNGPLTEKMDYFGGVAGGIFSLPIKGIYVTRPKGTVFVKIFNLKKV